MEKQPTKTLIAIDPGLATGICAVDISDMSDPTAIWDAEWTIPEFYAKIEDIVATDGVVVVIENYIITVETAKKSPQPWSLHLIGVVLFLAQKYGVAVTVQDPVRKLFATNDRLRLVGFWHVGDAGHAVDAYKHAMVWVLDNNRRWASKLILPDKENEDE